MAFTVDESLQMGIKAHREGRLQDAEKLYRSILSLQPKHPHANHNLGVLAVTVNKTEMALPFFKTALKAMPEVEQFWLSYIDALLNIQHFQEAEKLILLYKKNGLSEKNLAVFETKLLANLDPGVADKHIKSSSSTNKQISSQRKKRAEERNKIKNTRLHERLRLLSEYFQAGQYEEAEKVARSINQDFPKNQFAWRVLGAILSATDRKSEALKANLRAVTLSPKDAFAHYNLGVTLKENGKLEEAIKSYAKAIDLNPKFSEAYNNLGNTLQEIGKLKEAESSLRKAIRLNPKYAEAYYNLGNVAQEMGRLNEAKKSYAQAISINPGYTHARDNLLFMLNYDPEISAEELFLEYQRYGEFINSTVKHEFDHSNRTQKFDRRIRIGYSSADFRNHSCSFFIEPMLDHHNRDRFELFAYSNTVGLDDKTQRIRNCFDHWIDVVKLSDSEMAKKIYEDEIDILVDLSGHTKGNRLTVFGMRPAPVQVSASIGYGYTTGVQQIDYFLGDNNLTPVGAERFFSEKIFRISEPSFVYRPPKKLVPSVSALPAMQNGYITFGSLTRIIRLNEPLLKVWKQILDHIPDSRLRLDQKPFKSVETRELFYRSLEQHGFDRKRVDLTYSQPHWQVYQDIDITLDCWPHNAGTTTIESLWMGVPVLSKLDRPSVGRIGASILKPLGLEDWIVQDEETYIEKAVTHSSDLTALSNLRQSMRQKLLGSSLLDAKMYADKLTTAYQKMLAGERY